MTNGKFRTISERRGLRPLLREVREAEAAYCDALMRWGEHNLITQRAWMRWFELREAREAKTQSK